jgi:hypothetical protein
MWNSVSSIEKKYKNRLKKEDEKKRGENDLHSRIEAMQKMKIKGADGRADST